MGIEVAGHPLPSSLVFHGKEGGDQDPGPFWPGPQWGTGPS